MERINFNLVILLTISLFYISCNAQTSLDSVMTVLKEQDTASYNALNNTINNMRKKQKENKTEDIIFLAEHIMKQQKIIDSLKTHDNKAVQVFFSDTSVAFLTKNFFISDMIIEKKNIQKFKIRKTYQELTNYFTKKNYYKNISDINNLITIIKNSEELSTTQNIFISKLILNIENDLIRLNVLIVEINTVPDITINQLLELKNIYNIPVQIKYIEDKIKDIDTD